MNADDAREGRVGENGTALGGVRAVGRVGGVVGGHSVGMVDVTVVSTE